MTEKPEKDELARAPVANKDFIDAMNTMRADITTALGLAEGLKARMDKLEEQLEALTRAAEVAGVVRRE